jgi:hypothetical protein
MMSALLWRVLIAVVCVVLVLALLPPFMRIIGFSVSGDVFLIFRICIAGIALLYVLKGPPLWS